MSQRILYLGDSQLTEAASYLAGVLSHYGLPYDYYSSNTPFQDAWLKPDTGLVILSDYPAHNFTEDQLCRLASCIHQGISLLMIGGWGSFVGLDGNYHTTPLANVLPIILQSPDDRVNQSGSCLIRQDQPHPVVQNLPFRETPPAIGGFNRFQAKDNTEVILSAVQFKSTCDAAGFSFEPACETPLLVFGSYGAGKTAAFASDAAPHWVGPFVDWGDQRITTCAPGGIEVEVGCWYAAFFRNLVTWLSGQ